MRRGTRLITVAIAWLVLLAAAEAASAANLAYHGGPVAHSMGGVIVDWGANVNPVYTNETTGDPGLIKYLATNSGSTGDIGGVLAQYLDTTRRNAANSVTYGHQYQITPSVTSSTILDSQVQSELASQIQAGNLPHPAGNCLSTIYLVLFPSGDTECIDAAQTQCSGSYFCAYHSSATLPDGTSLLYAVLPDNTSGPMSVGCGTAPTLFGDQTSYLSHEWAETITDPLASAWWDSSGNEVGDKCNQLMSTQGGWTFQQEWSNIDAACRSAASTYSAPTASFVAPSSTPPGQQSQFDASSSTDPAANGTSTTFRRTSYSISSGIASYQWSWGDGGSSAPSSQATATHAYASTGTYQVSLTVTDALGFTATVTHQITVSGTPVPVATTGAATAVGEQGATLNGTVNAENQPVRYQFAYGTSASALDQSTSLTSGPTGQTDTAVSAVLSGLSPSTTYYYKLNVIAGGQTYSGTVQNFTTNAAPPAPAPSQVPIAATGGASQITASAALLTGTVNPGGSSSVSYRFSYGTSPTSLTQATALVSGLTGTSAIAVSSPIDGLSPNTTYYFRLDVTSGSQTYSGSVASFTTQIPLPSVITGAPVRITSTGATISGVVDPSGFATSYHFEYGTSRAYGHSSPAQSAGAGNAGLAELFTLAGLTPRTTYHFRLVAQNAGGTTVGNDTTFTTGSALGHPPRFAFKFPPRSKLKAALQGLLKVSFSCDRGCSAYFAVTIAPSGGRRGVPLPITVARATGRLARAGSRKVTIQFIPKVTKGLRRSKALKLLVSGYAVGAGTAPSAPQLKPLTLVP